MEGSTIVSGVVRPQDVLVFLKQRWGLARGDCSARRTFIRQSAHEIGRGCEKGPGGLDESPAAVASGAGHYPDY